VHFNGVTVHKARSIGNFRTLLQEAISTAGTVAKSGRKRSLPI
jgi:hypothetical protein